MHPSVSGRAADAGRGGADQGLFVRARGADLLRGAVDTVDEGGGWVRPLRVSAAQLRALSSVRAWHPGVFRNMAVCTSGVRLELVTDATHLRVELRMGEVSRPTRAILRDVAAHTGAEPPSADLVSVDVDGRHLGPFALGDADALELDLADDAPGAAIPLPGLGQRRRVRVWLPCLASCAVCDVTGDGTLIEPAPTAPVLLVLGDSIAQGFVADDPARTWPALLADELGYSLVNQGIGAQVCQPGSLADLPTRLQPAAVVFEFGENYRYEPCSASAVRRDVRALLGEVAHGWPDVPVWVLTTPAHTEDVYPTDPRSCFGDVDDILVEAAAAYEGMRVVNAVKLLDKRRLNTLLADGSDHPGAAGQRMMARRLAHVMRAAQKGI